MTNSLSTELAVVCALHQLRLATMTYAQSVDAEERVEEVYRELVGRMHGAPTTSSALARSSSTLASILENSQRDNGW